MNLSSFSKKEIEQQEICFQLKKKSHTPSSVEVLAKSMETGRVLDKTMKSWNRRGWRE